MDADSTQSARAPGATPVRSNRLPRSLTSFVGRSHEVTSIGELVADPDIQLVTLTGPGGVGKTRLALQVADLVASEFDHVGFVDGAPLSDAVQLLPEVARAAGLRESGASELTEHMVAGIGNRRMLLVIDNLEHLTEAGPELARLLHACPGLAMLVTSQVPLRIAGEREITIAPLPIEDAAILFADRARATRLSFQVTPENRETIARLCEGLDRLPLAIELAAARSKVLSTEAMLVRLEHRLSLLTGGPRDQPARLHSMRNAITWSHDLLNPNEQRLLRRLAIFAGSFDLDAAGSVAFPEEHASLDPLEALASLADKSLIRVDDLMEPPRFRMLETIRAFGLEQLDLAGEVEELGRRHARYFAQLADDASPWMSTAERAPWIRRLEIDYANLRAALDWFAARDDIEGLLRLNGSLAWFWYFQGHLDEGRRQLDRALQRGSRSFGLDWAEVLRAAARLAVAWGDNEQATRWAEESLDIFLDAGEQRRAAFAYSTLAALAEHRGDDAESERCYGEALVILRQIDDHLLAAFALGNLGDVLYRRGDIERAEAIAIEALGLAQTLGDPILTAMVLGNAAYIAIDRGDLSAAHRSFARGVREAHSGGHVPGTLDMIAGHAALAFHAGEPRLAARWIGAAEALLESFGLHAFLHQFQVRRVREAVRVKLGDQAFLAARREGSELSIETAMAEVAIFSLQPNPDSLQERALLSARERDVLALLVAGQSNRQIGDALFISHRTAQIHVANILAKLEVSTRAAAAAIAVRDGLVDGTPPTSLSRPSGE